MPKFSGKVVKAVRIRDSELGRVVGRSLKALRELAGLTPAGRHSRPSASVNL
jgi:hypothetical protein